MKPYTNTEPNFSETIEITEVGDPGHADYLNAAPKQLLENTLVNKSDIEELDTRMTIVEQNIEDLSAANIQISRGAYDQIYTILNWSGEVGSGIQVELDTVGCISIIKDHIKYTISNYSYKIKNSYYGSVGNLGTITVFFETNVDAKRIGLLLDYLDNGSTGIAYEKLVKSSVTNAGDSDVGKIEFRVKPPSNYPGDKVNASINILIIKMEEAV